MSPSKLVAESGWVLSLPQAARCRDKEHTAQVRGPLALSPHTRQGLHGEGPVPPLAAEGSDEAAVRLHDTSVQEAWEAIEGQHVAQLEGCRAKD